MAWLGRPTDYSDKIVKKAKDYVANYQNYGDVTPTVVGLCKILNRSKSTLYKWKDEDGKQDFSDILDSLKELQEHSLVNKGLTSDFNVALVKMMLCKHGYGENKDQTLTVKQGEGEEITEFSGFFHDSELYSRWFIFTPDAGNAS